jgi:putative DNA primase/helicase
VRRQIDGGVEFFVFPQVFKTELCAGFDAGALAKEMIRRDILKPDSEGRAVGKVNLPPPLGQRRMYHFSPEVLDGGDDEQV